MAKVPIIDSKRAVIGRLYSTATDTMASGATSSTGIDKRGWDAMGLWLPTITSGSVGANVSTDNSTWTRLQTNQGVHVKLYATGTGSCAISGGSAFAALKPWPYVMVTTAGSQAASRALVWALQG